LILVHVDRDRENVKNRLFNTLWRLTWQ